MSKKELYFSLDVEADGPIPGVNSLLSVGLAAFTEDGPVDKGDASPITFGINFIKLDGAVEDPDTMKWWGEHQEAYLKTRMSMLDPQSAMVEAISWVETWAQRLDRKPVCVAFPASYDFMWWHWYAHKFVGRDPFGFQAFDCKTAAAIVLDIGFREASKKNFPRRWWPDDTRIVHDHDAVNDAIEQGHMFVGLLQEARQRKTKISEAIAQAKYALSGSYKERVPRLEQLISQLRALLPAERE